MWETPLLVELEMNAEIGGYQADDSREVDEPVVALPNETSLSDRR